MSQTQTWQKIVAKYSRPQRSKSIGQLLNTLIPYALLWVIMFKCLAVSFWLMLPFSIIAAGLLVRIFIIFHDCGHGAFFHSQRANNFWGFLTGVLTFTPYHYWRHSHAVHHSHAGDLDERGWGDVWTMTVKEYLQASRWVRFKYRLARNPFCLFVIGPSILFLIVQRLPLQREAGPRSMRSVHMTNIGILVFSILMSCLMGLKAFLLIQLPVLMMAASAGVWLFYVQHQFEGVYWERHSNWDYVTEALKGSSFLKLPKVLQWFTGNIGFHHIHHLAPRIPNYFLELCYRENPMFQIKPITLWASFKSLTFRLWDEQHQRLVSFSYLKKLKYI